MRSGDAFSYLVLRLRGEDARLVCDFKAALMMPRSFASTLNVSLGIFAARNEADRTLGGTVGIAALKALSPMVSNEGRKP
jgi:hypothetical protein